MSAEHRKPLVAFIALAFVAAVLVSVQRADAQSGRFLASVLGPTGHVHGVIPGWSASRTDGETTARLVSPVFGAVVTREQVSASSQRREAGAEDSGDLRGRTPQRGDRPDGTPHDVSRRVLKNGGAAAALVGHLEERLRDRRGVTPKPIARPVGARRSAGAPARSDRPATTRSDGAARMSPRSVRR